MDSLNSTEHKNVALLIDIIANHTFTFAVSMFLFFSLIALSPCFAQNENNGTEEQTLPSELVNLFERVNEANEKLEHLTADINYQRAIPLLGDSEVSSGSFAFIPPDKIYLKLGEPRNEELVSDGEKWFVADHNARQVEIYAADKDMAVAESAFLKIGYGSDMSTLAEEYDISLLEQGEVDKQEADQETRSDLAGKTEFWHLRFEPKDKQTHAHYEQMEVKITDRFYLPETIILHESDGEILHTFELQNIDLDAEISPEIFEYEPPRGYSIITP